MGKLILFLLFAFTTASLWAQFPGMAKLDSLMDALEKNNKSMGTLVILKNNTGPLQV